MPTSYMCRRTAGFSAGLMLLIALMNPLDARQAAGTGACRITGRATSGTTPLPGVALTIKAGDAVKGSTWTETNGGYAFNLTAGQYTVSAELDRPSTASRTIGPWCGGDSRAYHHPTAAAPTAAEKTSVMMSVACQRRVRTRPDRGLRRLADETGGGYFELKKTDELAPTFTRVAQELHSQYTLGFTPTTLDGREHKLTVRIKTPGMTARARRTYIASPERLSSPTD